MYGLKPDGTKGGTGGVGGIGGIGSFPELSDFFDKTIASIIPTRIRIPTLTPIIMFLFFLFGYLS